MDTGDVIPIAAMFDENMGPNLTCDPRQALREAGVIVGVDVMSQREFLVYGKEALEAMAKGKARSLKVLRIGLDQETDELEKLIALVRVVRGHDDYQGGTVD